MCCSSSQDVFTNLVNVLITIINYYYVMFFVNMCSNEVFHILYLYCYVCYVGDISPHKVG